MEPADRRCSSRDVIISEGLVQYDPGRQFPNKIFVRMDTPRDNLPRPGPKIRAALAKLQTEQGQRWLYLAVLRQGLSDKLLYPRSDRRQALQVDIPA